MAVLIRSSSCAPADCFTLPPMSDEKSEAMATIQCTAGAAPERKRDGNLYEKGAKTRTS